MPSGREFIAAVGDTTLMNRAAQPEEIAEVIAFLASARKLRHSRHGRRRRGTTSDSTPSGPDFNRRRWSSIQTAPTKLALLDKPGFDVCASIVCRLLRASRVPRWLRLPFADPFMGAVQRCSAVGERAESGADLLPSRPEIADLFG